MNLNTQSRIQKYIPGLDGLRAVAVLAVIIYHMDLFPFLKGGFTGVDIFFVISGYVISLSIFNKKQAPFPEYLGAFYKRRILRIVPALIFCLVITHFVSVLFIPSSWKSDLIHNTGLSAFFGYGNFTMILQNDGYFSPIAEYNPFLHTWSLSVEEQFYLLFPLIFFLWLKFINSKRSPAKQVAFPKSKECRRQNLQIKKVKVDMDYPQRRWLSFDSKKTIGLISRILLPIVTLVSLIVSVRESAIHHNQAYYLLHSRFWELAAGAMLFQFQFRKKHSYSSIIISRILFFSGFLLIIAGMVFSDPWQFPFPWALFPVTGTVLIISVITSSGKSFSPDFHILDNPLMIYIGRISYSLYLWHWPVISLLRWTTGYHTIELKIISLGITVLLAVFSYHFIETKIRRSNILRKQSSWKILTGGVSVLLISLFLSQWLYDSRDLISLSVTRNRSEWNPGWYYRDELKQPVINDPKLENCQVFVLGDSHTAAYRTMLHILSSRLGIKVYEYEAGDCAIAGLLKPMKQRNIDHYEHAFKEIKELAQPGDIVFLASLRMPELSNRFEVVDISAVMEKHFSSEAIKDREIALEEADRIIGELEMLGVTVLIDAPKPVVLIPPYRCSDWFNRNNPIAAPGHIISTALLREIRKPIMVSLDRLQKLHPTLQIWDPFLVLCTGKEFSAYDGDGLPIYYDGDHLSANGNRLLEPSFEEKILEIWTPSTGGVASF